MIVFDVGNTDTVVGFFKDNQLNHRFRVRSLKSENSVFFEYRILNFMLENDINKSDLKTAVISSVVPILTPFFINFCEKFLEINPIVVIPSQHNLLNINIDIPEELGSDLYLNALAASQIYKGNCIVVDFGTALSFTTVSESKEIIGVNIFPGIRTAIKSLSSQTSLLPEVRLERPDKVVGKNTMHAIQSGIYFGYESLVRGMLDRIRTEFNPSSKVIATGGLSSTIAELQDLFDDIDIDLTLKGMYYYSTL